MEVRFSAKEVRRIQNMRDDVLESKKGKKHYVEREKGIGKWKQWESDDLWLALAYQVMHPQTRAKTVSDYAKLKGNRQLSINRLARLRTRDDLEEHIARSIPGMVQGARKASNIADDFLLFVDRKEKEFLLWDFLERQDKSVSKRNRLWSKEALEMERKTKDILRHSVFGFGPKSAADYLNTIGFSANLIALDTNVKKSIQYVKRRKLKLDKNWYAYENAFVGVAKRLKIAPCLLDTVLWYWPQL
ncbi:MAG: hypothetical protein ACE5KV_06955 [Thermoplasmata archaeon]